MSRRRYVVELDGHGLARPANSRVKAAKSRGYWRRRLGSDLDVVRFKGAPS